MGKRIEPYLGYVCDVLNTCEEFEDLRESAGLGFYYNNEEDFGWDLYQSSLTLSDNVIIKPIEVKSVRYTWEYLRTTAARNGSIRYGLTAGTPTQEEIALSHADKPEWLKNGLPINTLNGETKNGDRYYSKVEKMRRDKAGLIFLCRDGIYIYKNKDLFDKAILGYLWQNLEHTSDFEDMDKGWELKAAVNMDAWSMRIRREVPQEYFNEQRQNR